MTNKISNDPFAPWDQDAHSRDMCDEKTDVFNRMVDEDRPSDLRREFERLANAGDPGIIAALQEAGVDDPRVPKKFFVSDGQPATIYADSEGWHAVLETQGRRLKFTSPDRDEAMLAASRFVEKTSEPRQLTESELLRCARQVQGSDTSGAIELYVRLAIGDHDKSSAQEILTNPKYRELLNRAARTIWVFSRPDYVPSDGFTKLLDDVAREKPLTVNLVDALYDQYTDDARAAARSGRSMAPPASPVPEREEPEPSQEQIQASLETLTDEQVEKLRAQSLRHRADLVRRFNARMGAR